MNLTHDRRPPAGLVGGFLGGSLAVLLLASAARLLAQPVFSGAEVFPPEEFAARRTALMARLGDGVAILQGTTERPGEQAFRQNNEFFYLTGIAEPRAIVAIDARSKKTTVFLQPYNERRDVRMFGPGLHPGAEAARVTGVDAVVDRAEFTKYLSSLNDEGRTLYIPHRPEVLGEASYHDPVALAKATKDDPWDGRITREEAFLQKLGAAAAACTDIRDLDPIVDAMRVIKSPREIAVIREATRITGLAILEAMHDARPGLFEYELQADAEFVFKKFGAYGPSYFALVATGTNTPYTHYHRNTATIADGDLVQFDYAPDYKYYQSDVTRIFPANGRFTPRQREFYGIYLKLYQALMTSITVHAEPRDVIKTAVGKMDTVIAEFPFTDAKIRAAATAFVEGYRSSRSNSLGHGVGMEVHDPPDAAQTRLEPGMVFTIEPAMTIPDEHQGLRLEDMILITPTGYENMSAWVPIDVDAIELEMKKPGLSKR